MSKIVPQKPQHEQLDGTPTPPNTPPRREGTTTAPGSPTRACSGSPTPPNTPPQTDRDGTPTPPNSPPAQATSKADASPATQTPARRRMMPLTRNGRPAVAREIPRAAPPPPPEPEFEVIVVPRPWAKREDMPPPPPPPLRETGPARQPRDLQGPTPENIEWLMPKRLAGIVQSVGAAESRRRSREFAVMERHRPGARSRNAASSVNAASSTPVAVPTRMMIDEEAQTDASRAADNKLKRRFEDAEIEDSAIGARKRRRVKSDAKALSRADDTATAASQTSSSCRVTAPSQQAYPITATASEARPKPEEPPQVSIGSRLRAEFADAQGLALVQTRAPRNPEQRRQRLANEMRALGLSAETSGERHSAEQQQVLEPVAMRTRSRRPKKRGGQTPGN